MTPETAIERRGQKKIELGAEKSRAGPANERQTRDALQPGVALLDD